MRTNSKMDPFARRNGSPMHQSPWLTETPRAAFTLVELLAVIAMVALGALMLLPALARTRVDARAIQCLYNQSQLCAAWKAYAIDNNDALVINSDVGGFSKDFPISWAAGKMDWNKSSDDTNTLNLTDDRISLLAVYAGRAAGIFRCPADTYQSPTHLANAWGYRVRSVAMSSSIGDGSRYAGYTPSWWAKKTSDFRAPVPSQAWVFVDQHPDSIDDTIFYFRPSDTNGTGAFMELPASYHNGAGGIGFADGHAEIHKWRESISMPPVTYTKIGGQTVLTNSDLAWLTQHAPQQP